MSAWLPSTYLTKKATEHPRWYSLSATAAEAAAAAAEAIGAGLTACGPGALTTTATSLWKGQRRLLVLAPRPQALVPLALIGTNF
jgi:hypothetical protein